GGGWRGRQVVQRRLWEAHEPARHHRAARVHARTADQEEALPDPRGRCASHAGRNRRGQAGHGLRAPRGVRGGASANGGVLHGEKDMNPRWLGLWSSVVAGVFAIALVAALGPVRAAEAPGGNLVVQVPAEPPGLDLTASPASAIAGVVFYNVQEALVKVDKHGKLVPWLAERWYTTDSKNYTFFLR